MQGERSRDIRRKVSPENGVDGRRRNGLKVLLFLFVNVSNVAGNVADDDDSFVVVVALELLLLSLLLLL